MRRSLHSVARAAGAVSILGAGPRTSVLIGTGALVGFGFGCGATFLGAPVLGVPAGLWLVGIAVGAVHAVLAVPQGAERRAGRWRWPAFRGMALPVCVVEAAQLSARHVAHGKAALERAVRRLADAADAMTIGVDMAELEGGKVMDAGRGLCVGAARGPRWLRAASGLMADGPTDARRFDALVRCAGNGEITVFANERPGREAAWFDWASPMPLGYAGVFPARIDAARISVGDEELTGARARLVAALALCAATFARSPARAGKSVLSRMPGGFGAKSERGPAEPRAIARLAEALGGFDPRRDGHDCGAKSAARALTAYLATTHGGFSAMERLHIVENAIGFISHEPEAQLRLGAVRMAAGQRGGAISAFARAFRDLRANSAECQSDPIAFVLAEGAHAGRDRLTVGRVCGGVALACACDRFGRLEYLGEDLLDDLRHVGWTDPSDLETVRMVVSAMQDEARRAARHRAAA